MRPSLRLMWLGITACAVSMLAISLESVPDQTGLLLLAGLAGLLVVDLFISRYQADWRISLEGPGEIFTGETGEFLLSLSGVPPQTGPLVARLDWPGGLEGPVEVAFMPGTNRATASMQVHAHLRGLWHIDRLWLDWSSRLGLIQFCPCLEFAADIRAIPNITPVQSGKIDLKVRTTLLGVKENRLVGEGSEFHQLREYVTGMDTRMIDWKHSARHRTLMAKEMQSERNHHIILALDNGHLMREEIGGQPKIDHAIAGALSVAWAAGLGGDLVGYFAFDSRPGLFTPPEPGRQAFPRLRSRMGELAYTTTETNFTLALAELHRRLNRRSMVVIFSDFVDTTTAELMVENISILNRAHVIVFVALRDPRLEAIAHGHIDGMTDVARAVSASQMIRERRIVMERLSRLGVFALDVLPSQLTPRLVTTYLDIKSREVI